MASTGVYPGRFQPFHDGHKAMILEILKRKDFCLILMRYGEPNESNPHGVSERLNMINDWVKEENLVGKIQVLPIPDPGYDLTVYYGRKVGYAIEELRLSEDVEKISATKIRGMAKEKATEQDTGGEIFANES